MQVKGVNAYQYTLASPSALECNATLWESWKNETGFDMAAYQGAWAAGGTMRALHRATNG